MLHGVNRSTDDMMMPSCMCIDVEEDKKKLISFFSEMDWNAKWDWDNLAAFNSKASESLKMLQLTNWGIDDDGEIDTGSFDLSGIGGSSGGSGSDLGTGPPVKSSKSASTDSSSKEGMTTSSFPFQALEGSPSAIIEDPVPASSDLSRTSLEASVISVEPLMGLKLGKRTYFENNCPGSSIKSPTFTVVPVASSAAAKKAKSSSQNGAISRCQVEGCNLDLSSSKDYHRKHKVCDIHSKCPRVTIAGVERRFCQQCSRFHSLVEFDDKKRSCRRRLADHNARRRKPRQDTIQFNSTKLSSSFYDGRQNMNFSLSNVGCAGNSNWESLYDSKFTLTKHIPLKPDKVGNPPLVGFGLPSSISIYGNSSNELSTSKRTTVNFFKQGFKDSTFPSNLDAAPDLPRALSLLSTNACGLSELGCISFDQPLHASPPTCSPPTVIPHGFPVASSENWQIEQHSSSPHLNSFAAFASGTQADCSRQSSF